MRVYLAAAITNAGRDLGAIRAVLSAVESSGHEVPSRQVADPLGREVDGEITDAELARRDLAWVKDCDAVVAEVSTPSHGVGVEVAAALQQAVPVLLLHRRDAPVSRLLLGLAGVEVAVYGTNDEIAPAVRRFLAAVPASGNHA